MTAVNAPPEILEMVFTRLRRNEGLSDLQNVCLVNKSWHDVAITQLYHTIVLSDPSDDPTTHSGIRELTAGERAELLTSLQTENDSSFAEGEEDADSSSTSTDTSMPKAETSGCMKTDLLLRTLEARPEYASYIRDLDIQQKASDWRLLPLVASRAGGKLVRLRVGPRNAGCLKSAPLDLMRCSDGTQSGEPSASSQPVLVSASLRSIIGVFNELRCLDIGCLSAPLVRQMMELAPNLETLIMFRTTLWDTNHAERWEWEDWSPPPGECGKAWGHQLSEVCLQVEEGLPHSALRAILGLSAGALRSLMINVMDPDAHRPRPQRDSLSPDFWDGIRLPRLHSLRVSGLSLAGLVRLLSAGGLDELAFLDLRQCGYSSDHGGLTGDDASDIAEDLDAMVPELLRNLPRRLRQVSICLEAQDDTVAECFIAHLQQLPRWLPELRTCPLVQFAAGGGQLASEERHGYMSRLESACLARGLSMSRRDRERMFRPLW